MRVRNEYNTIIKAKDELILEFLQRKRTSFGTNFVIWGDHSTLHQTRSSWCSPSPELAKRERNPLHHFKLKSTANGTASSCCDNVFNIVDNRELLSFLRKQEEIMFGSFEREKAAMSERFQQEQASFRKVVKDK